MRAADAVERFRLSRPIAAPAASRVGAVQGVQHHLLAGVQSGAALVAESAEKLWIQPKMILINALGLSIQQCCFCAQPLTPPALGARIGPSQRRLPRPLGASSAAELRLMALQVICSWFAPDEQGGAWGIMSTSSRAGVIGTALMVRRLRTQSKEGSSLAATDPLVSLCHRRGIE